LANAFFGAEAVSLSFADDLYQGVHRCQFSFPVRERTRAPITEE